MKKRENLLSCLPSLILHIKGKEHPGYDSRDNGHNETVMPGVALMKGFALSLFLIAALATQAQRIEPGSHWYNGAVVYESSQQKDGKIVMNAMAEGEELEFILVPAKKKAGTYQVATSPNSGIALYEEGTTVKHIQREGLDILCLHNQAGQLFRMLTKTDEWDCQKLNVEHWMQTVRGSYTMQDGTRVTIDWTKALVGGKYIPVEPMTFNGFVTDLITFDGEGTPLNGTMEVRPTIEGIRLYEVGFDDYGTWHRLNDNAIDLTESDPNTPRFHFACTMPLTGTDIYDYDKQMLRLMRNTIYARHGYVFESAELQEYFGNEPWYQPVDNNKDIHLSFIEELNVELIKSREASLDTEK